MQDSTVKRCRICGDKAMCFNHSGLSCNPCRLFFNRNISNAKKLKCLKTDNCQIDSFTRKCCPKCRLTKCLSIGMKRERIIHRSKSISFELNKYELQQIDDIQSALRVFEEEHNLEVVGVAADPVTVANLPGVYIRRIIKFCKSIDAFRALNKDDQLIMLKRFSFEFMMLRIAFNFDFETNSYYSMVDESGRQAVLVSMDIFNKMNSSILLNELIADGHVMHLQMENDLTIRDLISAILIFKNDENYSCPEFVRYHFCMYTRLLRRYFEHKYNSQEKASQKLLFLLNEMNKTDRIREVITEFLYEIGLANLEQITVEVFNLS